MTVMIADWPDGHVPPDILAQQEVEQAIRNGASLPRWGWPTPRPYNGATGVERIHGWQITLIARRVGLLAPPRACSVCGKTSHLHFHSELYGRPLLAKPICRSCHFHVHRRFRRPDDWQSFLAGRHTGNWTQRIPVRELTRSDAMCLERTWNPLGLLD